MRKVRRDASSRVASINSSDSAGCTRYILICVLITFIPSLLLFGIIHRRLSS